MARLVFFFDFELVASLNGQVPLQALKQGGDGKDEGMQHNVNGMSNGGKVVLLLLGLSSVHGRLPCCLRLSAPPCTLFNSN